VGEKMASAVKVKRKLESLRYGAFMVVRRAASGELAGERKLESLRYGVVR
jgi:hypothetical protein